MKQSNKKLFKYFSNVKVNRTDSYKYWLQYKLITSKLDCICHNDNEKGIFINYIFND